MENSVQECPPPRKLKNLQALIKLKPIPGSEWSTFAFVLNRDMILPDGTLDDLHCLVFPLGSFSNREDASKHAKETIETTGHPAVIVARYGSAVPMSSKFDPNTITNVAVDIKGKLIEMESEAYKKDREIYENRVKLEQDIMKEAEEEKDENNIEHFKRQAYLAVKNYAKYIHHKKEMDESLENFKMRKVAVAEHYNRHPEHESQFLPYFKEKLAERGELELYHSIENGYNEIREELLSTPEN